MRSGIASLSVTGSPSKRSTASRFRPRARTCATSASSAGRSQVSSGSRSGTSERPPRSTNKAGSPPSRTTSAPATRAARVAGALVVTLGGEPALFVERGGRSLVPLRDPEEDWLRPAFEALVAHARRTGVKRLAVERFDSEPVAESAVMELLVEAGFLAGPRRAVLRG